MPEVIRDGVSGAIVESTTEVFAAVERVLGEPLHRKQVRAYFESRFTASRMAEGYLTAMKS